jgi:Holliday junction DNA helicase RuvB
MCDVKSEDGCGVCSGVAPPRVIRDIPLVRGLPRERLLRTIRYHARASDASRRAAAFYLVDLDERREYKAAQCASAVQFAMRIGYTRREARELLDVGKALEKLPLLDEAFNRGEICWSKLRKIALVATAATESKWLAFAAEKNSNEVDAAVKHARHGEAPPQGNGLGTRRVTFRLVYDVSAAINNVWQTALEKTMRELGAGASVQGAIQEIAELVLRKDPEGNVPGRRDREEPIYSVVYHVGPDGRSAWLEGEDGRIPIPLETALEAAREGEVIEVPDIDDPGDTEAILFGERGSVPPGERDRPTTPAMRRAVKAREGHRCAVCRCRRAIRTHHLESLAKGGKTLIEYLAGLCDTCHSLCHEGLIRLEVENGVLIVLDSEGRPIRRVVLPSEDLGTPDAPLIVVKRIGPSEGKRGSPRAPPEAPPVVLAPLFLRPDGNPLDSLGFRDPGAVPPLHDPAPVTHAPPDGARAPLEASQVVVAPRSLPETGSVLESVADLVGDFGNPTETEDAKTVRTPHEPHSTAAAGSTSSGARAPLEASEVVAAPRFPLDLRLVESIDDLPGTLTAAEWRSLEDRLEWSGSRHAFLLRPTWSFERPVLPEARDREEAEIPEERPPSVRPETFAEIIGQERVVEGLLFAVRSARDRGETVGHVLLSGQPGLGKTTLARALASELGGRLQSLLGFHLMEPHSLLAILPRLREGDVFFIDEIHRLPLSCSECLHEALEDGVLEVFVAQGLRMRAFTIRLERFTLVGATTELGSLPEPFRARFAIEERIEPYDEEALARIIERAAVRLRSSATEEVSRAVARRSRGTPREAIRLLKMARDVAQRDGARAIDRAHVEEAAARLGIDPEGLRIEERRLIEVLIARGAPMGIEALAATLRMDPGTVRRVHEPCLAERGYIVRTPRGREATEKARQRFGGGGDPANT